MAKRNRRRNRAANRAARRSQAQESSSSSPDGGVSVAEPEVESFADPLLDDAAEVVLDPPQRAEADLGDGSDDIQTEEADAIDASDPEPAQPDVETEAALAAAQACLEEARKLLALGNAPEALNRLGHLLGEHPDNVPALVEMGRGCCQLGQFTEAHEHLTQALVISPDDIDARQALGMTFFRRGLYAEAEAILSVVCARSHDRTQAHYYRAEALTRLDKVSPAIRSMERAIELEPENVKALRAMGHLYDRVGRGDKATEMFKRARALSEPELFGRGASDS